MLVGYVEPHHGYRMHRELQKVEQILVETEEKWVSRRLVKVNDVSLYLS